MSKINRYLIILIFILAGFYYVTRPGRFKEKEVTFLKADSTQIYRISFREGADSVDIYHKGKIWMLEKPVAWRVGDGQKEVLEHAFLPVKTSKTPMSEDPSKQVQYNVSPGNSVSIRLYDKQNKLLDHVYIGQSSNNNFSYGRREGSNQIFQLKKNIYAQISAQPAAWRAPEIINFRLPDLLKVEVKYTKNTYRLNVKGNGVYYEDSKETFPLNPENRATSKFFMALSNLSTFTFFDNQWQKYAANFAKPAAVITIKTIGQKEIKLTFAEGPDDSVLLMRNDEHETLYGLNYDTLNRFTISAEHFKE